MYYVYILYSESGDRYYKGMSQNPENRLKYHNLREKGYTSRYRPWKLVWKQAYETKEEALAIEQRLKKWKSRKMIERVIRGEIEP
jgi:predicted GIY-YIG superfamily endonuclease